MSGPSEFEIQRATCIWLDGTPATRVSPSRPGALRPGVVYWHTANGGSRRDEFEGKRLKQIGVKPGIHDLLFLWGGLYGLEMKEPGGRLSAAQLDMHPRLLRAGMVASATVDNLADAKAQIIAWGLAVVLTVNK